MSGLRVTPRHRLERLKATLADINAGPNPARIELFDGLLPSAPDAVTSARLLAVITLQLPAGEIVSNALHLVPAGDGMAVLTGVVGWGRLVNGAGEIVCDGLCTASNGDGPFRLSALQLYAGGAVRLVSAIMG
ncbi:hypothetical protein [Comamonas guangdongensis]|uniref:Uncharacterized protein n=1 Tax=Comamonas guangdongensis TaxID=510515 RepID=A0ABV3ZW99_9BURK